MYKGKPPAGLIQLDLAMYCTELMLHLKDDGRGLAFASIHREGLEKGLLNAAKDISDDDAASLIFAVCFSTSSALTEVAGRGAGMDAVQDFVKRDGVKFGWCSPIIRSMQISGRLKQ